MPTYTWLAEGVTHDIWLDGYATLFNGDEGPIEVVRVELAPSTENDVTGAPVTPGTVTVSRISAHTVDPRQRTISATKHDTDASDVPSQVVCATKPVDVTAVDTVGQRSLCSTNYLAATSLHFASGYWSLNRRSGSFFDGGRTGGTLEPLELAEGEGFAIVGATGRNGCTYHWTFEVVVRIGTSVYRYVVPYVYARYAGDPVFSLLNGTGSGVTVSVLGITLYDQGSTLSSSGLDAIRLIRSDEAIAAVNITGLRYGSISAHDAALTCPASIRGVLGPHRVKLAGEGNGVPVDWWTGVGGFISIPNQRKLGLFRTRTTQNRPTAPGPLHLLDPGSTVFHASVGRGIRINQGQALSLAVGGLPGAISYNSNSVCDVRMTFVHTPVRRHVPLGQSRIIRSR